MGTVEITDCDTRSQQPSTSQPSETGTLEQVFVQAGSLHAQGRLDQAEGLYKAILEVDQDHLGSLHNLAILCFQRGRYNDAVALTRGVLRLRPDLAVAHNTLGVALRRLGRLEEAEACCRQALRLEPEYAEAHNTLGDVLTASQRLSEAEACCREALRLQPAYAEAYNNLGTVLTARVRLEEAEICIREALRLKPGNAAAFNNLGAVLVALGRPEEAEVYCREAVRLAPGYAEAHANLGTVLVALGRPKDAEICCREAVRLRPGNAEAYHNLGIALSLQEKLAEAAVCFEHAAALNPDDKDKLVGWFYMRQEICDWSRYREDEARVRKGVGVEPIPGAAFRLLGCNSTPEEQLAFARRVAAKLAVPEAAKFSIPPPRPDERIRLGYFSANFHFHPVATLIAGLIEHHDRRRFEVIAYSFDEDDGSAMRRRLVRAFDRFIDISEMPNRDAAQLINADKLDVLIDLHGWTPDCRANVLAYRPAPIQVSFLGYAGTTAADFIDYIIADRFVVPPDQQSLFSEQVIYLPDCFLPNDDKREIAERTPSRGECGLPERGFVFCCFNNSWKLTPDLFDIWMRLLRAVPQSVLWLYEANPPMKVNLAREAEARGVAAARLVFAQRVLGHPEHLARYRQADLFLDTLPYNAHTTASDALWAGLPVLTCAGDTFAGRVGASLLRAIGLNELVTTSREEYEALALRLAREADQLERLRARLAQSRQTCPLFDTARYTGHLEAAFWQMCEIRKAGQPSTSFSVAPMTANS
jgi:protein O-GlcNAc transferase